jgi:hypothetical protein
MRRRQADLIAYGLANHRPANCREKLDSGVGTKSHRICIRCTTDVRGQDFHCVANAFACGEELPRRAVELLLARDGRHCHASHESSEHDDGKQFQQRKRPSVGGHGEHQAAAS